MNNIETLLILLKKLLKFYPLVSRFNRYKYNYTYIESLAITNICEIPIGNFSFPLFPKDALPSIEWIILVVQSLLKIYCLNTERNLKQTIESTQDEAVRKLKTETARKVSQLAQTIDNFSQRIENDQVKDEQERNILIGEILNKLQTINQELGEYDEFTTLPLDASKIPEPNSKVSNPKQQTKESLEQILDYYIEYFKQLEPNLQTSNNTSNNLLGTSTLTLEDYNNLYNQQIRKPDFSNYFQEDKYFAYMQVAGPNPLMIQRIETENQCLSITGEKYQEITAKIMGGFDNLAAAIQEGRLYLADYSLLQDLRHGNFPQAQKYIYAPQALFAVPPANSASRDLLPIAIRCQEALFTPLEQGTWMSAKNILQMADSNYHELVSHLAHTHLFVEPFIVATHHLPATHPVRMLLQPHFQGTVLINYGAHKSLIAPGGGVDKLLASTIESEQQLVIKAAQHNLFTFNNRSFPDTLKSRGVDDENKLPIYPYRDDGMLIWNAIHNWVTGYLNCFYNSDSSIINDLGLQSWAATLSAEDGGRVTGFGEYTQGKINTREYLAKALSIVIFTASAQHAAVNFPQGDLMLYVPAFPLARYTSAPTTAHQEDDFIKGLPPLDQAKGQIDLLYLLGSIYCTNLGNYQNADFESNTQVKFALIEFQKELLEAERIILERNQTVEIRKVIPYEYLCPVNIPQSINI